MPQWPHILDKEYPEYSSRKQTLLHADGIETCVYHGDDLFQIVSWT